MIDKIFKNKQRDCGDFEKFCSFQIEFISSIWQMLGKKIKIITGINLGLDEGMLRDRYQFKILMG